MDGWVRDRFAGDLVTLHLTHDHRACNTAGTGWKAAVGAQLRKPETDNTAVSHELRTILLGLPTIGLTAARRMLVRGNEETNALLTRTNGEALVLSRALFDAAIPHRYQRPGGDKAAPGWIGERTAGLSDTRATRAMLDTRLKSVRGGHLGHPERFTVPEDRSAPATAVRSTCGG